MDNNKKYIQELDILRGLFCIYVLIIHITATPSIGLGVNNLEGLSYFLLNIISKMAVPGFIFISGLSLFYVYKDKDSINPFKFYFKRFIHVVIPYIIYTAIYYAVYIYKFNYELSWNFFIENLINGTMVYHLYYIIIIIQFYILFPIMIKAFKKIPTDLFLTIAIVINLYLANRIESSTLFIKYMMFFALGAYMGYNYEEVSKSFLKKSTKRTILIIGVITIAYYAIGNLLNSLYEIHLINNAWYIFSFISILMYFILATIMKKSTKRVIIFIKTLLIDISKVSFSVYLLHPLVLLILEENIKQENIGLKYLIIATTMFLVTIVYAKLIKGIKKYLKEKDAS